MDSKRLILFIALSFGILLLWRKDSLPRRPSLLPSLPPMPRQPPLHWPPAPGAAPAAADAGALAAGQTVHVKTDLLRRRHRHHRRRPARPDAERHAAAEDERASRSACKTAKAERRGANRPDQRRQPGPAHPPQRICRRKTDYAPGRRPEQREVRLTAPAAQGVQVSKVYTFTRGSYLIRACATKSAITAPSRWRPRPTIACCATARRRKAKSRMAYTFTGPAVYTEADKFQKVKFEDIDKEQGHVRPRCRQRLGGHVATLLRVGLDSENQ